MSAVVAKTILLVEDNESDEKLTLRAFKNCGVANHIVVQRDGADALEWLLSPDNPLPTIVLLDLNLPRIDGLEVLKRIREDEKTKLLPVVILTASKEQEDVVRSYSLGANAYVRKPVDFSEFAKAAQTLGLFWLLMNEAPKQA